MKKQQEKQQWNGERKKEKRTHTEKFTRKNNKRQVDLPSFAIIYLVVFTGLQ